MDNPGLAETFLSTWDPTKKYVAEVKEYRERRSLDANAYFHVLVGKIAEVMNLGIETATPQALARMKEEWNR